MSSAPQRPGTSRPGPGGSGAGRPEPGGRLPDGAESELTVWQRGVEDWLNRVEACLVDGLMPTDVVALRQECERLEAARTQLGRGGNSGGVLRRPGPVFLAGGARRLNEQLLPALKERILSQFPAPGAAGKEDLDETSFNLPAAIDLLGLLERTVLRLFQARANGAVRQDLCKALALLGRRYHRWLMDGFLRTEALEGEAEVRKAVRNANFDQLRMELVPWCLEALDDRRAVVELRQLSKITARTAVRVVDRDLLAYLESHEPDTRARLRPVLEAVDEVMALLRVVLQPGSDDPGEGRRVYFVQDLGAAVSEQFIHHMGMLVIALFEDVETAAERDTLTLPALRVALLRVEEVLEFCRLVDHPLARDAHLRGIRVIRNRGDMLTGTLERKMLAAPARNRHAAMLRELHGFVERRCDEPLLKQDTTE